MFFQNLSRLKGRLSTAFHMAQVYSEVMRGADVSQVSVNQGKLDKLRLKEQFNKAAIYPDLFKNSQFVFFGDTNHSDISLHKFFYGADNIKNMAAGGIRHVFPEIEPEYQDLVDLAAQGKLKPANFAMKFVERASGGDKRRIQQLKHTAAMKDTLERLEDSAKGFRLMHQSGMKIHCLDDRANLDKKDIALLGKFMTEVKNYIADTVGYPAIIHGRILVKYLIDNAASLQGKDMMQSRLMHQRMADDPALAKRMLAAAGKEKGAILFGAGHAANPNSLFDCLGRDRTVRVDLYSRADLYADKMSAMDQGTIDPHYVHILGENKLYKFKAFKG